MSTAAEQIPTRWTPLRWHEEQHRLIYSPARFKVVAAGRRSGKTELLKRQLVRSCLRPPAGISRPTYLAAAPTRDQAKRIFWQDLKLLAFPHRVVRIFESELTIRFQSGAELIVAGLDRPQRFEGFPIDGGGCDEIAEVKRESWEHTIRPALSTPDRPPGWWWFTGRPKGRGLFYELFSNAGVRDDWESFTWKSDTIVSTEEIEAAKRDLDPLTFAQEYEAAWVTFEGLAYYQWSPLSHLRKVVYDKGQPLIFCFDFNVAPGVAAVLQEQRLKGEKQPRTCVIDEVHIPRNSNTPLVCETLVDKWGGHEGDVMIYGDATGGSRHTSQTEGTDWELVRQVLRPKFGGRLRWRVEKRNPDVRDRINAVNSRLRNTAGDVRFAVNPDEAPNVVKDFEGVTLLEGGSGQIDKKGCEAQGLTHLTDAIGYYIEAKFGLKERQTAIY